MKILLTASADVEIVKVEKCMGDKDHWYYKTINGRESDCYGSFSEASEAAQDSFDYYSESWSSSL